MDPKTTREKSRTTNKIDDLLHELPDDSQLPHLEMGDELLDTLGNEGEDIIDGALNRKEEEDLIFEKIIDKCNIPGIKDEMDETGQVPESIYFFYGGDSDQFVEALKFIGIQGQHREFATFLMSDEGRRLMTQNKLSIHVETGDIFYDSHNTEEKFFTQSTKRRGSICAKKIFIFQFLQELHHSISAELQHRRPREVRPAQL